MRVELEFRNGDRLTLDHVESVRLVRQGVEVTCFGNGPVVHRDVVAAVTRWAEVTPLVITLDSYGCFPGDDHPAFGGR
jgi:hypothetical protein